MEFVAENLEDTRAFAEKFAKMLRPGDVVLLTGDLGAGKTTFVKAVAKTLGFDGLVTSPTFTLLNEYSGRVPIYHFDMYRLKSTSEAIESGLDEILRQSDGVCFVEWPQKVAGILPEKNIMLDSAILGDNKRKFRVVDGR